MTVSFDLPADLEQRLMAAQRNPSAEAREAYFIKLYIDGQLTHRQLSDLLNVSRYALDGILKRYGIMHDISADQIAEEADGLAQLRNHAGRG
jgi:predicted HTH domain antitoxin